MITPWMRLQTSRRGAACAALVGALLTSSGLAGAAEQAEPGPAAVTADPPAKAQRRATAARPYRVVQVVSAALFGVAYVGSLVSALVFHDESKAQTEKRHVGYLAYPIAGPFVALGVYERGAQLFVPIGITQGLGALGFLAGTIGVATVDTEPPRAGLRVTPMAGPDGASLQMTWRY